VPVRLARPPVEQVPLHAGRRPALPVNGQS
jgi:hypothetical protein